ncbi:phosphotransferase [Nocardioides sp.]|uniref:phosphotransferase n=1 Tax=Nocardioides sp. TaxID=35761 RepID=UPI00286CE85B|nr:phosphotransferase [Nocardioides sp.]
MTDVLDGAAAAFGLGTRLAAAPVAGGLSNDLWRLETERGVFAVKVMRVNAGTLGFRANIEAAHAVEARALARGIACPSPVLSVDGQCLADVGGALVRVHQWCEGWVPRPEEWQDEAGALLARIHGATEPFDDALDDDPWDEAGWASLAGSPDVPAALADRLRRAAPSLALLETATAAPGLVTAHAWSHGDLDPKNTLVVDGALIALDWDAAGPRPVLREAVSVALDWSTDVLGFRRVLTSYCRASGSTVVGDLWPFGGWVSALGGWLAHNATARIDTDLGRREVAATCDRLLALQASLPAYRDALATAQR